MRLQMTTLAKGVFSSKAVAARVACMTKADWQALWAEHTADEAPAPALPHVEFARDAVIGVFGGTRPSSGWTVEVTAATLPDVPGPGRRTLTVRYRVTGPSGPAQDVLTSPFHMVALARAGWDRVAFERLG